MHSLGLYDPPAHPGEVRLSKLLSCRFAAYSPNVQSQFYVSLSVQKPNTESHEVESSIPKAESVNVLPGGSSTSNCCLGIFHPISQLYSWLRFSLPASGLHNSRSQPTFFTPQLSKISILVSKISFSKSQFQNLKFKIPISKNPNFGFGKLIFKNPNFSFRFQKSQIQNRKTQIRFQFRFQFPILFLKISIPVPILFYFQKSQFQNGNQTGSENLNFKMRHPLGGGSLPGTDRGLLGMVFRLLVWIVWQDPSVDALKNLNFNQGICAFENLIFKSRKLF